MILAKYLTQYGYYKYVLKRVYYDYAFLYSIVALGSRIYCADLAIRSAIIRLAYILNTVSGLMVLD